MTTPVPAPRPRPLLSTLQWTILILGLGFIALYLVSGVEARREQAIDEIHQKQAAQAEVRFDDVLAALRTPAAFEAKCGKATWHKTIDGRAALVYDEPIVGRPLGTETLTAIFGGEPSITFRDRLDGRVWALSPESALKNIGCSL